MALHRYRHDTMIPLVATLARVIHAALPAGKKAGPQSPARSRLVVAIGWLVTLAIQAALLILIAELVEVCHGVMELYLDLAQQQLDLTSIYVAATTPK